MQYSKKTLNKIDFYKKLGFTIIEGNNPMMRNSKKWNNFELIRICQTNSKYHGFSLYTVWAVKELS